MLDSSQRLAISAIEVGCIAQPSLIAGTEFRVASVFTRSCYLVSVTGDWICLLPETATADPLGVRLRVSGGVNWHASGVAAGMHCWCGVSALHVGAGLAIHLSDAPTWTPPAPPPCNRVSLMRGLTCLDASAMTRVAGDKQGLLSLVYPAAGYADRLAHAADPTVRALRAWLRQALPAATVMAPPALDSLVGLGPGLTPSGDDFIGGVLATLYQLGYQPVAERLYETAAPLAAQSGNPISAAYLAAAARGAANADIHRGLHAVLNGDMDEIGEALRAIGGIGHTSGFDTFAGVIVTLRCVAEFEFGGCPTR